MLVITQNITDEIIDYLMDKVGMHIKTQELLKKMPEFLNGALVSQVKENIYPLTAQNETTNKRGMDEQKVQSIPALHKDTLMPKELARQKQQKDGTSIEKDISLRSSKRQMFVTKNSLRMSVNPLNKTNKSLILSTGGRKKKQKQSFVSLNLDEEEEDEPEYKKIRKRKEEQLRELEKDKEDEQKRIKILAQKRQVFDAKYKEKQFTFDFQGGPFENVPLDEPLVYNSMKLRLSNVDKRLKENAKKPTEHQPHEIMIKKKFNKKFEEPERFDAALNIPMFSPNPDEERTLFGIPLEVKNYRLKDYRKHYGGKFTRLQKSLNTIDIVNRQKTPKQHEDLFTSRRHLKDDASDVNKSIMSQRSKEGHRRKLALPRLQGKYSTLDRYEDD